MNAVEIEEALSALAEAPFEPAEFPYQFLTAFGNKDTTIKRLRKGDSNASDIPGAVLQRSNIHLATCAPGKVHENLQVLRDSPRTLTAKAKFILATDGQILEAEDLISGEVLACEFAKFADHFGFFLPLAGISTIKEIKENPFDVRATGRLTKLYIELLQNNKTWASDERRSDMNHFMARLVFCFFAEDTDIFHGTSLFTKTLQTMTESDGSNTHTVLETIFRAMNLSTEERATAKLPGWAERFPYVNGGLFSGGTDVPVFTRTARSYLLRTGELKWQEINPDIFGSMIQAVADEEERGSLGMHYTSVPNILKVLNPLFLNDLRAQLEAAGENKAKLLNLRKRMARIRVFDPACGSGNFLVIAYKQMREIEAEINRRRGEAELRTEIPLTNFRGIELREFPAEIARLALVIAEFQSDVVYRGQKEALATVLPLDSKNWITCGNALRMDWLRLMDVDQEGVRLVGDDLFSAPVDQAEIDFDNELGETYICGNPPYLGNKLQSAEQKADLEAIFSAISSNWKSLDYVAGWFMKAALYGTRAKSAAAFVSTNSICQGQQVPILWPLLFGLDQQIYFAYTSFKWANLASRNAGVSVVIVGIKSAVEGSRRLYSATDGGEFVAREVAYINAYLTSNPNLIVEGESTPINGLAPMMFGNMPRDGGNLLLTDEERLRMIGEDPRAAKYLKDFVGSEDAIHGTRRVCIWVNEEDFEDASSIPEIAKRFAAVKEERQCMKAASTQLFAKKPYRFVQIQGVARHQSFLVPRHSSEARPYLPIALYDEGTIVGDSAFAMYDAPLWSMALFASRIHLVWVATVCGKLETRYRYSNTIGWNTFPVPQLTDQNKYDLTRCAEDILLARESHYPATIADLYDPEKMPDDLRRAHERNDEVLERIYIGRRFRNDTERLEKLFDLYTKMTAGQGKPKKKAKK
ncbi:class I SAM-dependent DNA methyltransferase [Xanthomonas cucurbitae]|uniref:site-specific DNA-methyltransferase (adenine-specific) n=1 Tax=Xanthomonas cucurbitae TaxID=56453 RepID=A0ABY7YG68_9XANT|nr:DNA methyltransferase [Xanthomonas cucurbitae]WDM68978.1 lactate dehydrogenase [Xanthomonas cucurbitae]WDM72850.1 lactate dehydrogenase [Xanthomonas cucurbitae]